jgi:hypothetical protein
MRQLLKRLLLTMLVVFVVIEIGLRYHLGAFMTVLCACVLGLVANFLLPRE